MSTNTKPMKARNSLKIRKCANGFVVFTQPERDDVGYMMDYDDIHVFIEVGDLAEFVRHWLSPPGSAPSPFKRGDKP